MWRCPLFLTGTEDYQLNSECHSDVVCPPKCRCEANVVECSNLKLTKIPERLPQATTELYVPGLSCPYHLTLFLTLRFQAFTSYAFSGFYLDCYAPENHDRSTHTFPLMPCFTSILWKALKLKLQELCFFWHQKQGYLIIDLFLKLEEGERKPGLLPEQVGPIQSRTAL